MNLWMAGKVLGVTKGSFQRTKDRFGNADRAVQFSGKGAGVGVTGFPAENKHTVSLWVYISDPSTIPEGPIPFTEADTKYELYNWVSEESGKTLRGLGRRKATVGFNRYIPKTDGTRQPWYLWAYKPAEFNEEGWYHIFVVQGEYYTRMVMYKPSTIKAYSYIWLGAQDFSGNKYLYVGGCDQNAYPLNGSYDDLKIYNVELTDDQISVQHTAELPLWEYVRIKNNYLNSLAVVAGASKEDGTRIQLGGLDIGNEEWRLTSSGNGECRIKNLHSGKLMVVKDASQQTGADIIQYEERGTDNEVWILDNVIGNTKLFRLKNKHSNLYLSIAMEPGVAHEKLIQSSDGGEKSYWSFGESMPNAAYDIEDGLYRLKNKKSGKYLTVRDRSEYSGARLVQHSKDASLDIGDVGADVWSIHIAAGENSCRLFNTLSELFMTSDGTQSLGNAIFQANFDDTKVSKWQFYPTGKSGEYYIRNAENYLFVAVQNASVEENAPVTQYRIGSGENDVWILERVYYNDSPLKEGTYTIENVNSRKQIVVKNASTADGAEVIQFADEGSNASWSVRLEKFGYVTLVHTNSGKEMVVRNASLQQGEPLIQYGTHGGNGLWRIKRELFEISPGIFVTAFTLKNKRSGLFAVVKNASTANYAPIIQYATGEGNRFWYIDRIPTRAITRTMEPKQVYSTLNQPVILADCKNDQIKISYDFEKPTELLIRITDVAGKQVYEGRKNVTVGNNVVLITQFNAVLRANQFYVISVTSTDGQFNHSVKAIMNN